MDNSYDSFKTTELVILGILDSEIEALSLPFSEYFSQTFTFAHLLIRTLHDLEDADYMSVDDLADINRELYGYLDPDIYEFSYLNPVHAVRAMSTDLGRIMSAISAELIGAIPLVYRHDTAGLSARLHLLYDSYTKCRRYDYENLNYDSLAGALRLILGSYVYNEFPREIGKRLKSKLLPDHSVIDLKSIAGGRSQEELCAYIKTDECIEKMLRAAYLSGEYISDNETKLIKMLAEMDSSDLIAMADTYVGGYVEGFEVTGRDLSKKKTVELMFNLGFIPMELVAMERFAECGLECTMGPAQADIFAGRTVDKSGVFGANMNPQYDIDHKDDLSLVIDRHINECRLAALKETYEEIKDAAAHHGGPAVVEIFGEPEFEPQVNEEVCAYDDDTRPLKIKYMAEASVITNEYIPGDERSFTVISYPVPSIGDNFREVFDATVRINTLDYYLYRDIQQKIIDTLDQAEYVSIKGMGDNHTDLRVHLHHLEDPKKQTNFENCVADVNIPVGEVFTSPLLEGTEGVLHVTHVYLFGIEYHDLEITIKDGFATGYDCAEGAKLMTTNIFHDHETLPMGECAIGTNTTAFVLARKLGIESKLPILIAEKTGPHFAFGDTCYSQSEDLKVYNPDGKEIIARDNEHSLLRKTDPALAYYNCHTDVTVPYDELGRLSAVLPDGSEVDIISNGRFVLEGCEPLNEPFEEII